MLGLALAHALILSLLRNPLLWALAGAALAFRWILDLTFQLGLTVEDVHELAASYELAFLAGALAVGLAIATASRHAALLHPASPGVRLAAPVAVALVAASAVAAAAIVPAHWTREWQPLPFDAQAARTALALGWTHLALIGLAVQPPLDPARPPTGRTEVAAALAPLVIGFLVPAAVGEGGAPVRGLLDVSGPLRAAFDLSPEGAQIEAPLLSILCWAALATLRALPPARRAHATAPQADPGP